MLLVILFDRRTEARPEGRGAVAAVGLRGRRLDPKPISHCGRGDEGLRLSRV
jgi:hypothetical protein